MEFFGFILVHTADKEVLEKCQFKALLKDVVTTNVANFILEEPTTLREFIKKGGINALAKEYSGKGVGLFIECLTLKHADGSKVLKEGEHAGKPINELISEGVIHLCDHDAIVVNLE